MGDVRKQIELALVDYSCEFTSASGGWAMGIADAVMPVVQVALEQAWDEGFDVGWDERRAWESGETSHSPDPDNPYVKGAQS